MDTILAHSYRFATRGCIESTYEYVNIGDGVETNVSILETGIRSFTIANSEASYFENEFNSSLLPFLSL